MAKLEMWREIIDVTTIQEPDRSWRLTDSHGHVHRWVGCGDKAEVTTCNAKTIIDGWYEPDSPISHIEYRCRECGDEVKPGWRATEFRRWIPGLPHFLIDGVEVTKSEYEIAARA